MTVRPDILTILERITSEFKSRCSGQYVSKYCAYFKNSGKDPATLTTESLDAFESKWSKLDSRLEIVAGKDVLSAVRSRLQQDWNITLTDVRILDCYKSEEVPQDLVALINASTNSECGARRSPVSSPGLWVLTVVGVLDHAASRAAALGRIRRPAGRCVRLAVPMYRPGYGALPPVAMQKRGSLPNDA